MTPTTPPVCSFCGNTAEQKLVFDTNAASGMNASLRTSEDGREVAFHFGSVFDGDICSLARDVEIRPGTFSACDGCAAKMLDAGLLKLVGNYMTGEIIDRS